ncbi:MAG TPA: DUF4126 family protein [Candidatus Angelobacter sp.]|jgi:uncharacterized membrane protein
MNPGVTLLLSFSIAIMAGFRSLVTPAVVAWAAHLRWINLQDSPLSFMGTTWAVGIFTALALVEVILDKLPSTPARTSAVQLSARVVTGALTGACLAVAGGVILWLGALAGAVGAIAGAFGGYRLRASLGRALRVPDFLLALTEDLVIIGLGVFLLSRF